jgi:predicted nucleic acid-binding protein
VKKSVYIETTIVSYLTGWPSADLIRAARQAITKRWWRDRRRHFDLFTSQVVLEEAGKGDERAAARRTRILQRLTRLGTTAQALALAAALIDKQAMPPKAAVDALHLAVASVEKIDILLTWNCTHLANGEMLGEMARVIAAKGHRVPIVCTPEELMGD